MNKNNRPRVALLWGGRGYESEVSSKGKEHLLPLLNEKFELTPILIDKEGRWLTKDGEVLPCRGGFYCQSTNKILSVDCVIPLLHGDFGEDGTIQGALECARLPYVGCDTSASAICRDKSIVKTVAARLGVPTLPFVSAIKCEGVDFATRRAEESLSYPMLVKPARLGSSVGVGSACCRDELRQRIKDAFELCPRLLIEPFLQTKRELECGFFAARGREILTFPGEILLEGTYGYEEKYHDDSVRLSIRADVEREHAEAIRDYSRRLVRAVGVRDISRIDFFLSDGRIYFNEINTMPGFTDGSLYAKMIGAMGISEGELFSRLVESAIARA